MPRCTLPYPWPKALAAMLLAAALACPPGAAAEEGDKPQASDSRSLSIPVVIAPVVQEGRLVGYLYLGLKVTANQENAAERMRDELPLLQDQILRAFNNAPIPAEEAGTDKAKASLIQTATAALAGLKEAEGVAEVELTDIQNVPF